MTAATPPAGSFDTDAGRTYSEPAAATPGQAGSGIEVTHDPEIPVHLVQLRLCDLCLDGAGECHTPGCSLWINRAPDISLRNNPMVTILAAQDDAATPGQAADMHVVSDADALLLVCLTEDDSDVECGTTVAEIEPGNTWHGLTARIAKHAAECHPAAAQGARPAPGTLRGDLEATVRTWREESEPYADETAEDIARRGGFGYCAGELAQILAAHPEPEPAPELAAKPDVGTAWRLLDETREQLAVLQESIGNLAAGLKLSASATRPSKKSDIEDGVAAALLGILDPR